MKKIVLIGLVLAPMLVITVTINGCPLGTFKHSQEQSNNAPAMPGAQDSVTREGVGVSEKV